MRTEPQHLGRLPQASDRALMGHFVQPGDRCCGQGQRIWKIDMANLVSIDWSIEEFRRLISEQPQSDTAGSSIETSVDVNAPTSATIDRAPPLEDASSREADAASEGSGPRQVFTQKNDRSSDLMVADVMALTALRAAGSDKPISSPESDRVRGIALDILNPEVAEPSNIPERASNAENAVTSDPETAMPDPGTTHEGTASARSEERRVGKE